MDREFDFGSFRIHAVLKGEVDEQPAFEVTFAVPRGPSHTGIFGSTLPLPSEAALYVVREMRRLLKLGIQRYTQFRMLSERRGPAEAREVQGAAAKMNMVLLAVQGGDASLSQAEAQLQQEFEREKAEHSQEAQSIAEDVEKVRQIAFDLGPVKMLVRWEGVMPGERGELAAFRVDAEVPGVGTHTATVATDSPLFSGAAEWMLEEMRKAIEIGSAESYAERERARFKALGRDVGTDEAMAFAQSLFAVASALGTSGIDQAQQALEIASVQEKADAEEAEIARLEKEREEVRKQIEQLRHRRRPRGA